MEEGRQSLAHLPILTFLPLLPHSSASLKVPSAGGGSPAWTPPQSAGVALKRLWWTGQRGTQAVCWGPRSWGGEDAAHFALDLISLEKTESAPSERNCRVSVFRGTVLLRRSTSSTDP